MWQCRQDSLPGCQGANSRILFLTIGRASQPFPRSKPDVRLSPHPAFQIMTYLLSQSASSRCRVKSPFKSHGACLTFPLMQKPLPVASSLSCQTFTLSRPLQSGFWLLRWLGQPSRTLAFSRLSQTVKRCGVFPGSSTHDVSATRSCLLYTGGSLAQQADRSRAAAPFLVPFGSGVSITFTCL